MTRKITQSKWSIVLLLLISGMVSAEEAKLQWAKVTTLSAVVTGVVAEVKVDAGQRVKKGQTLLLIEPEVYSSRLRSAESLAKRNNDLFKEAGAEYRRSTEMYENSMLSEHDLEVQRLALLMAEAEDKQSQAKLASARFLQRQSVVIAPFDAIVTDILTAENETINGKMNTVPLIKLVSSSSMSVVANLSLDKAMKLSPGKSLKVKLAGKQYDATISSIQLSQGLDDLQQGALLELVVNVSPGSNHYPGLAASIELP